MEPYRKYIKKNKAKIIYRKLVKYEDFCYAM